MLQGSYGREPFDLRLTVLRLLRQLHIILGVTFVGTLLFGGGYYVKNVLFGGETLYEVTSVYHVEYDIEKEVELGTVYINPTSWNTYLQSTTFLEAVQGYLQGNNTLADGSSFVPEGEEMAGSITAYLASDLRVPSTKVVTENPEESLILARAVEKAMVEMAAGLREVVAIEVVSAPTEAMEVLPDVRVGRAVVLSMILSLFFVIVILLIKEIWTDGIHLPSILRQRYGLRTVGTFESKEAGENLKYFFEGMNRVALCPVSEECNPAQVCERLDGLVGDKMNVEWFALPTPTLCSEVCGELREADGILLLVQAGCQSGRELEQILFLLEQQDCKVTAALLMDADESLIRWYYKGAKGFCNGK